VNASPAEGSIPSKQHSLVKSDKSDNELTNIRIANCDQPNCNMHNSSANNSESALSENVLKREKAKEKRAAKQKRGDAIVFPWKNSDKFENNLVMLVLPVEIQPIVAHISSDLTMTPASSSEQTPARVLSIHTLPFVLGIINGFPEQIFIDTGSSLSLIDWQAFPAETVHEAKNVRLFSASNHPIEVLGKITLNLKLGRLQIPCEFIVIKNLEMKILMGNNTFAKHRFNLDYDTRQCEFKYNNETSGPLPLQMQEGSPQVNYVSFDE
jgi:Aspartyl protease